MYFKIDFFFFFFFQAEDGIRAATVTGVQTCALPIFNVDPRIPVTPNNITTLSGNGLPGGFFRPLDAAFASAGVPVLGSVRNEESIGRSRYDGMNISYRQRDFHKIDLIANY